MIPENLLKIFNSLNPLEENTLLEIEQFLLKKKLKKKELLIKQNQICKNIYFIESGLLRSFYMEEDTEVTTWFMKENDLIISVKSFFMQKPGNECIEAIEDCVLYYISFEKLYYLYKKYPSFCMTGLLLTQHYYIQAEDRLFNLRKKEAAERYKYLLETHPEIGLRSPLKYIASYLGITLETLSRIRGNNAKSGKENSNK